MVWLLINWFWSCMAGYVSICFCYSAKRCSFVYLYRIYRWNSTTNCSSSCESTNHVQWPTQCTVLQSQTLVNKPQILLTRTKKCITSLFSDLLSLLSYFLLSRCNLSLQPLPFRCTSLLSVLNASFKASANSSHSKGSWGLTLHTSAHSAISCSKLQRNQGIAYDLSTWMELHTRGWKKIVLSPDHAHSRGAWSRDKTRNKSVQTYTTFGEPERAALVNGR